MASSVQRIQDFHKWLKCSKLGPMDQDDLSMIWEFALNNPNNRMSKHVLMLLRVEAYWRRKASASQDPGVAVAVADDRPALPALQDGVVGETSSSDA